tara:strand:+ start:88 stop:243 length:156 start_codon:yes stop_codon:yes gene_type:complete
MRREHLASAKVLPLPAAAARPAPRNQRRQENQRRKVSKETFKVLKKNQRQW